MARVGGKKRERPNALFHGDNLEILRKYVDDSSVDLIYLDPPFQSGRDYNLLFKRVDGTRATSQIKAFTDTWTWDHAAKDAFDQTVSIGGGVGLSIEAIERVIGRSAMLAYISMMALRLLELRRVLRATGTLYLHCDPTASHYLKILLDAVFGPENFRGEIIWKRTNARSTAGRWPWLHDVLLMYSRSSDFHFTPVTVAADNKRLPHTLITGADGKKYQTYELTAPGRRRGKSGEPWRGYDPNEYDRHWANDVATREAWDKAGLLHWPKKTAKRKGWPRRRAEKPFEPRNRTVTVGDVWTDINRLNQSAKERIGYPTQKPVALLQRLIEASSKEGDVVLDPFCGCGTTIHAAHELKRRWIGIDLTKQAIDIIEQRMEDHFGEIVHSTYALVRDPLDVDGAEALAKEDRFEFQRWAIELAGGGAGDIKKGADGGIDSILGFREAPHAPMQRIIVSVKSGRVTVRDVRELEGTVSREKAAIGVLITLKPPGRPMKKEAASAGFYQTTLLSVPEKYPRIQILTIEDLFAGATIKSPVIFRRKGMRRKTAQTEFSFVESKRL